MTKECVYCDNQFEYEEKDKYKFYIPDSFRVGNKEKHFKHDAVTCPHCKSVLEV